jgi:tetratricopeptide (TPR) repeat protein
MDQWVRTDRGAPFGGRQGPAQGAAAAVAPRTVGQGRPEPALPGDVAAAIRRAAETATAHHREALVERMEHAVAAYDRNRFQDAARLGVQLAAEVGAVPEVRRLAGFASYRLGRWRAAVRQLEAYLAMTDDAEALPALMDCWRALGRHSKVTGLWGELRHASPDADVLAEARMVAAGSLADRGDLQGAIELLTAGGAARALRNPSERHLRQWYAMADLYERAGDVPRARELFTRVARVDPEAYEVEDRLAALGRQRRPRPSRRRGTQRTTRTKSATTATATAGAEPARPPGRAEPRGGSGDARK